MDEPKTWQRVNPGDHADVFPPVSAGDVTDAIATTRRAFTGWASLDLDDRKAALRNSRLSIERQREDLAHLISREVGKPLTEARGEVAAVIAKFDLTFADADRFIADQPVDDGPHPGIVRSRPRGVAAVVAPYNFPIHLGHGAALAYLLAGNTVVFKPSPLAANTGAAYVLAMQAALPLGAMEILQGGAATARALVSNGDVRSVCFTGSVEAGRQLAIDLAEDYSKIVALELGGKNATIVLDDANLAEAARAVTDSFCLTTGQRCNASARVYVHRSVADQFIELLESEVARYQPGNPLDEKTTLGPLVSERAVERYSNLTSPAKFGEWIVGPEVLDEVDGRCGYYVRPAVLQIVDSARFEASPLFREETFCPILAVIPVANDSEAVDRHNAVPFGLSASVFTSSRGRFESLADVLHAGNIYLNLPTTLSPSTLPFGGFGASGNGRPGGRGFIRFAADQQALQIGQISPEA